MAFARQMDAVVADAVYESCFGNLPNGTTYIKWNPKPTEEAKSRSIDVRYAENNKISMEAKALFVESNLFATSTNYSATSGSVPALMPIWWDTGIIDEVRKDTPLWNGLIPHVSNKGLFADWTVQSARSAGSFEAEGAALTPGDSTYTHRTKPMKYAYVTREVSGPMLAGSKSWIDAAKMYVDDAYQAMNELLEIQICRGTSVTGGDSNGFSGFCDLVTTNYTDRSSGAIRITDLRTAIVTPKATYNAHPNLIVTDYYTFDNIKALVMPYNMYNGNYKIAWGLEAIEFEGLPIIVSKGMYPTANSREIHVYDTSVVEMRVLQEPTLMPLAQDRDTTKFTIKAYCVLVIKAEKFCHRIYGIA